MDSFPIRRNGVASCRDLDDAWLEGARRGARVRARDRVGVREVVHALPKLRKTDANLTLVAERSAIANVKNLLVARKSGKCASGV